MKRDHAKANSLNQNEVPLTNENGRFLFQCRYCDKKLNFKRHTLEETNKNHAKE